MIASRDDWAASMRHVPRQSEAVSVERLYPQSGLVTLMNDGVGGACRQKIQRNRGSQVQDKPAHCCWHLTFPKHI